MPFTVETPFFLPYAKSVSWTYVIHGTGSEADAFNALGASANAINIFGSFLQDVQLSEYVGSFGGEDWYKGTVTYGPESRSESPGTSPGTGPGTVDPGWKLISFDLNVGTEHITQSNAHIARFPGTAPNFKGAIGVTDQGIQGADVWVPSFAFTLQKRLPFTNLTDSWLRNTLKPMHLHYNNASWRGFPEGTVLFHSASGQSDGGELVLTANFQYEENVSSLTVGTITGISKKGWEHSWTKHVEVETSGKREIKPDAVYIERLYDPADFSALGA